MSKKTVAFKMPAQPVPVTAESWVESRVGRDAPEARESATVTVLARPPEPMKRFTIDVGEGLHRRIKAQCANKGAKMADVIRELLEREFPTQAKNQ